MARGSLSIGSVIADRYEVEELLASGGFGHVFAAHHVSLHTRVAIKVVRADRASESYQKRFLREARVVSALRHPNIVSVLDLGKLDDGTLYLAMEYVDGVPLHRLLKTGAMPPERSLHILEQVASALHCAHTNGVLHRDLKPANVMVVPIPGDNDHVKLIDFGILKHFSVGRRAIQDGVSDVVTSPAAVVGTPDYMAPEQILQHPLDGRADVYALGIMAYEMFVGHRPFAADNYGDLMLQQLHAPPPAIDTLRDGSAPPPTLEAVLRAALAKDPSKRPSNAPEFIAQLRDAFTVVPRKRKSLDNDILRWGAAIVIPAVTAAGAVYFLLAPSDSTKAEHESAVSSKSISTAIPVAVTQPVVEHPLDVVDAPESASAAVPPPSTTSENTASERTEDTAVVDTPRDSLPRRDPEDFEQRAERHLALDQPSTPNTVRAAQVSAARTKTVDRKTTKKDHRTATPPTTISAETKDSPDPMIEKSTVSISVIPYGTVRFASGQQLESPIKSIQLKEGKHRITVIHPTHTDYNLTFSVEAGKSYLMKIHVATKTFEIGPSKKP